VFEPSKQKSTEIQTKVKLIKKQQKAEKQKAEQQKAEKQKAEQQKAEKQKTKN
jgi:hypothetical protein